MNKKLDESIKNRILVLTIFLVIVLCLDYNFNLSSNIFDNILTILFSTLTVIGGIWISCYLIFFQLYKNRYPLKIIKKKYLPQMLTNFIYIIFSMIIGIIAIIYQTKIFLNIYFIVISLTTTFKMLYNVYKTNESFMINSYIDDYCEDIIKDLELNDTSILKETIIDIKYILDESILKEEYYVVQNISSKIGVVFREFLLKSISLISNGENSQTIEALFDKIIDINIYQLKLCKNINSDLVINDILNQNYKNLEFCINTGQFEWFKRYMCELKDLIFLINSDEKLANGIFKLYTKTLKFLIDLKKYEYMEPVIDEILKCVKQLKYMDENSNLRNFIKLITILLIYSKDEECEEAYKLLSSYFAKFIFEVAQTQNTFSDVRIYYHYVFENIKNDNNEIAKEIIKSIFNVDNTMTQDPKFIEFKFYCLNEINKNSQGLLEDEFRKYQIQTIEKAIQLKENYQGYIFFPQFCEDLVKSKYQIELIDSSCEDLVYILNSCVVKDNLSAFYFFLSEFNNCLFNTQKQNKDAQSKMFDIYIWLIGRTVSMSNKQFFQIAFHKIKECIEELDKNRAISKDFGNYIIENLTGCARKSSTSYENEIIIYIVRLFSGFLHENKELHFISTSMEHKKNLYKSVFNIGTICVEYDFEEGIRIVSNTIGWLIIYSIKQSNTDMIFYLIERAGELYSISKKMDVSSKTLTFMLTLFTTIGTYCCKDPKLSKYLTDILKAIKNEDIEKVKIAISLRISENENWNDLFENKTEELSKKFIAEFERGLNSTK